MVLRQTLALNWSGDGSASIPGTVPITGDDLIVKNISLINGTINVICGIRLGGLGLLHMKSDVNCTVTFRDAGGVSVGAVSLLATIPYAFATGVGTIPISGDAYTVSCVAAASGSLTIRGFQDGTPAVATAVFSGTLVATHLESGIVTGGYTGILTLTGATWQPTGAAFNAQRQAIIDGLVAATSQANGWNNVVKATLAVTTVVRTSDTVVTITLPAFGSYDISANETITATIPTPATTADAAITATPTATITAGS